MLGLSGCRLPCPDSAAEPELLREGLSTPERALDTFVRAFACDDAYTEYACFSDSVKRDHFNGFAGYKLGRSVIRDENRLQMLALRWTDLAEQATVELRPDGSTAVARISLDGQPELVVLLANEPRYFMVFRDGTKVEGYATDAQVEIFSRDEVLLALRDPSMERPKTRPVMLEVQSRWVIRDLGGLVGGPLAAARNAPPARSPPAAAAAIEDHEGAHEGADEPPSLDDEPNGLLESGADATGDEATQNSDGSP